MLLLLLLLSLSLSLSFPSPLILTTVARCIVQTSMGARGHTTLHTRHRGRKGARPRDRCGQNPLRPASASKVYLPCSRSFTGALLLLFFVPKRPHLAYRQPPLSCSGKPLLFFFVVDTANSARTRTLSQSWSRREESFSPGSKR